MKLIIAAAAIAGIITLAANTTQTMLPGNNDTAQKGKTPTPAITNSLTIKGGSLEVVTDEPVYFENTKGFFAQPKDEGTYPGVVMIHEWWGLNDNIKVMAQKLASEGYMVLAVDLYEGSLADTSDQARTLSSEVDDAQSVENMKTALQYLREKGASRVAALGWCFGGGQSLKLSLSGVPLNATVIYYGNLVTDPAQLAAIKWPVLGVFGDRDQSIPVDSVNKFESELTNQGIENEIYIYPGVGHAFANPTGENYAAKETEDAWNKTVVFLNKTLKTDSI